MRLKAMPPSGNFLFTEITPRCFPSTIALYSLEKRPEGWTMTENNLGSALQITQLFPPSKWGRI